LAKKKAAKEKSIKKAAPKALNDKQKRFCEEYLKDLNGAQAYIRAGYAVKDEAVARSAAARLLADVAAQELIATLQKERAERTGTDADMVVTAWREIATANPNDLMEFRRGCCRHCWGVNFRYQRTPREMEGHRAHFEQTVRNRLDDKKLDDDPGLRAALHSELMEGFDEEGGIGFNSTKDANPECPECFGEGVGYAYFKDTRKVPAPALRLYGGVKVTKEGIEVKVHSQERALEMLARHNGMLVEKSEVSGPGGAPIPVAASVNVSAEESYKRMLEG
jgi:phage terminase small subunit